MVVKRDAREIQIEGWLNTLPADLASRFFFELGVT
jgi:hypothetical protein